MDFRGKLTGITKDFFSGHFNITFEMTEGNIKEIESLNGTDLSLTAKKFRNHRSLNANALMWVCLQRIAEALSVKGSVVDKWEVYLSMLKKYGESTYVCVKPEAVEAVKNQWRECEEVGELTINGHKAVQLLCYFGSSTYDTKQMSHLLEGIIYEMKQMEIPTPTTEEMERSLKEWEKYNEKHNTDNKNLSCMRNTA